jgi:hypothetical protein
MFYQKLIAELLADPTYDPRHIEALMRLQYGTLDHLTRDQFRADIKLCTARIDAMGREAAERTAKSYGL